jgi:hypothetical protein
MARSLLSQQKGKKKWSYLTENMLQLAISAKMSDNLQPNKDRRSHADRMETMIAASDIHHASPEVWVRLAAPLAGHSIFWRQGGKPIERDGKFFARFVPWIDANSVRERLDAVVPGEWDLTLTQLPAIPTDDPNEISCSFKASLQVQGVVREDVGTGRDYKQAATDAFKRAAVRFGIAHELSSYGANWVELDGDGELAKPIEDPALVYARGNGKSERAESDGAPTKRPALALDEETCPKCGGRMWDNRSTKRNPRAPDYKCRDRACDGVIWPPKPGEERTPEMRHGSAPPKDQGNSWAPLKAAPPQDIPF